MVNHPLTTSVIRNVVVPVAGRALSAGFDTNALTCGVQRLHSQALRQTPWIHTSIHSAGMLDNVSAL